jgi:hypothetical protein
VCGFCHAPEHAYDVLLEDTSLGRDGLCSEARERLLMAATPLPEPGFDESGVGLQYDWNEDLHAWETIRRWGSCTICGRRTWKLPDDPRPQCCAPCAKQARLIAYVLCHELGLVTALTAYTVTSELPERRGAQPRGRLRVSDYEVHDTRDFEGQLGPRTFGRRPVPIPASFREYDLSRDEP